MRPSAPLESVGAAIGPSGGMGLRLVAETLVRGGARVGAPVRCRFTGCAAATGPMVVERSACAAAGEAVGALLLWVAVEGMPVARLRRLSARI